MLSWNFSLKSVHDKQQQKGYPSKMLHEVFPSSRTKSFFPIAKNCFYFVFVRDFFFSESHKTLKTYKTHINLDFFIGFNKGREQQKQEFFKKLKISSY